MRDTKYVNKKEPVITTDSSCNKILLQPHLNLAAISKMKHQTLICVHSYMINSGIPESWVELKLEGIEFGDGEKKSAHNIRLQKSAFTLLLQGIIAILCFFVPFHQGVISVDVLFLVDGLHGIFVDALLDKFCDHIHLTEKFFAFGIDGSGVHKLMADEPTVLKECLSVDKQLA